MRDEDKSYVFEEFPWQQGEPDTRQRLGREGPRCRRDIDCRLEGASFAVGEAPPKDEITVMAYNAERGFHAREQIELLLGDPGMPPPDVILLSEADRGCSRTACRDIAREYARSLGMYYVFGVEFIELPRLFGRGGRITSRCEHGNTIISRYPLGNAGLLRFRANRSWFLRGLSPLFGEPRLGGRMALAADIKIGQRYLHLCCTHLESGRGNERLRAQQAEELARDASARPFNLVLGGDINCGSYLSDLHSGSAGDAATQTFFANGFSDAHAHLPLAERTTTASGVVVDLILGRGVVFTAAGVGPRSKWGELSDHLPVWATVRVD